MNSAVLLALASLIACGAKQVDETNSIAPAMTALEDPNGLDDTPGTLDWKDTSPGWTLDGPKLLLTGTIYQPDGKTPARDIILYYYQTNTQGRYQTKPDEPRNMQPDELGRTHGYIRGWIRTGSDGKYAIYTVRPGTYPTNDEPAHIHVTIKEPNVPVYYIDDFVFDDDPLLTSRKRLSMENRCGSGVLRLVQKDNLFIGERDLFLGLNIPGHPNPPVDAVRSGRNIGEDVVSFIPHHAWGPDKGTRTCPICKYGWYHGILYFVGNNPDWTDIKSWLTYFEKESIRRDGRLKVYFVYGSETNYSKDARERELEALGRELNLTHVALTFVPSLTDTQSEVVLNRIDPGALSTFILYRRSRIIDKAIDLKPDEKSFQWIADRLDRTRNEYFNIPKSVDRKDG